MSWQQSQKKRQTFVQSRGNKEMQNQNNKFKEGNNNLLDRSLSLALTHTLSVLYLFVTRLTIQLFVVFLRYYYECNKIEILKLIIVCSCTNPGLESKLTT